jgi:hypothetical protein
MGHRPRQRVPWSSVEPWEFENCSPLRKFALARADKFSGCVAAASPRPVHVANAHRNDSALDPGLQPPMLVVGRQKIPWLESRGMAGELGLIRENVDLKRRHAGNAVQHWPGEYDALHPGSLDDRRNQDFVVSVAEESRTWEVKGTVRHELLELFVSSSDPARIFPDQIDAVARRREFAKSLVDLRLA